MEERAAIEAELRRRFRFSEEDLEANRSGQLTAAQRRLVLKRQREFGMLRILVAAIALVALFALFTDGWVSFVVTSVVATVLVLPFGWLHSVRTRSRPFSVTGPTRFRRRSLNVPADRFQVGPWWRRTSFAGVAHDEALAELLPRATAYFAPVRVGPPGRNVLLLSIEPA